MSVSTSSMQPPPSRRATSRITASRRLAKPSQPSTDAARRTLRPSKSEITGRKWGCHPACAPATRALVQWHLVSWTALTSESCVLAGTTEELRNVTGGLAPRGTIACSIPLPPLYWTSIRLVAGTPWPPIIVSLLPGLMLHSNSPDDRGDQGNIAASQLCPPLPPRRSSCLLTMAPPRVELKVNCRLGQVVPVHDGWTAAS